MGSCSCSCSCSDEMKSFPQGGIHPSDNKMASAEAVKSIPLPSQAVFLLNQHIGAPAKPVVKPGDKVVVGQLIAEAATFVSANIHSSVSGTVKSIDQVKDVSGYKRMAIIIDVVGDEWSKDIDRTPAVKASIPDSSEQILNKIKSAGIVGLGGAAFPTHVKLAVSPSKTLPEFLLINGAECEPYLTSDHRVMLEHAEEVIIGIKLLLKATGIARAKVGVEANKMDAVKLLRSMVEKHASDGSIEIYALKMLYPQGGERQLVKALVGREIPPPPKGLPLDVGCVVVNVATTFAVYEAVQKNKPLIERVVTVTGKPVKKPGNFRVRFGTSVTHLLNQVGGVPEDFGKITAGGPMMGRAFADMDSPVTKGMSGYVLYTVKESRRGPITNCIRCGRCVSVCPLGLEPYLVAALAERGKFEKAEEERIVSCCDCGCCAYICPANRPLTDSIKVGKAKILELQKEKAK